MPTSIAPRSYWPFDEASGDLIDGIGSNTATETGGTIAAASGLVSGARDFELADTEHFIKADPANLRAGNNSFSIAGWINIESRNGDNSILGKWDGSGDSEYLLWLGGGDSCNWSLLQAVGGVITLSPDLAGNGVWHFIVAWHDAEANQSGIAVNNGTPTTTAVDAAGIVSSTLGFAFGAASGGTSFFDGLEDEWGWYPGVLTAGDRTFLFNGGAGRSLAEIVASGLAVPSGWMGQWPTVVRTGRR